MKRKTNGVGRGQKAQNSQSEGPNWILIAGGALFSTLSIRLGYKLKQTLDSKFQANSSNDLKGNGKSSDRRSSPGCRMHSNVYSFTQDDDGCFNCISAFLPLEFGVLISIGGVPILAPFTGDGGIPDIKHPPHQILSESDVSLPLVAVPAAEFTKENGVMWVSSPDCLELPPKPLHHSNCSDSPCVSESGSDVCSKREVIQKLRQQLKRRDEMILEMQDQIMELQNSLNAQLTLSTNLQSQLDAASRDLFDSEKEIQRLRKAIADHCVKQVDSNNKPPTIPIWPSEVRNGHSNGYPDSGSNFELSETGRGDGERIGMLKRDVGELKEVIEGKEYLLRSYKEQKAELTMKILELQHRLDHQLPNIL